MDLLASDEPVSCSCWIGAQGDNFSTSTEVNSPSHLATAENYEQEPDRILGDSLFNYEEELQEELQIPVSYSEQPASPTCSASVPHCSKSSGRRFAPIKSDSEVKQAEVSSIPTKTL